MSRERGNRNVVLTLISHSPTQASNPFSDAQAVAYELSPVMSSQPRAAAGGSSAGFARTQSDNSSSEASGIARGEVGAGYGPYAVSRPPGRYLSSNVTLTRLRRA